MIYDACYNRINVSQTKAIYINQTLYQVQKFLLIITLFYIYALARLYI